MKEAIGAARVGVFDHIVRNAAMSAKDKTIKIPAQSGCTTITPRGRRRSACEI